MTQTIDINKTVEWFTNRIGNLTYSMYGSRDGSDGTADCSGSVTQAIYEAGASKPAFLYSTETIHGWLLANGYVLVSDNDDFDGEFGDVIVMGQKGQSAGASGHIGILSSNDPDANFISTCYYTQGEEGTAVQDLNWNYFWQLDGQPYIYVYRYKGEQAKQEPAKTNAIQEFQNASDEFEANGAFNVADVRKIGNQWLVLPKTLGGTDPTFDNNGIPLELLEAVGTKNASDFQIGKQAKFKADYAEGTIDEYDVQSNGVRVEYDFDDVKYPDTYEVWFDADQFIKL